MFLLFNGGVGSWDELAIALIAVGVLWVAVKLAGRKTPAEEEDEGPVQPPTTKPG